jgi:hypothetical protein
MLPAPARIAATPSPNSRECWNPAVPPPPVAGATVGTGLGVGLGDGVTVGLVVGLGDAVGLGDEVTDGVVVGLTLDVGVGEPLAPGEIVGGDAEGDPEQPESAAEAIRAKVAPPTVSFARRPVPIMAVRFLLLGAIDMRWPVHHWVITLRD